jgi:hypothetical protein
MQDTLLPIIYSGYFDAPLAFLVKYQDVVYLFWRGYFDEELDEFPSEYQVFPTTLVAWENAALDWDALWKQVRALGSIGTIHMKNVPFDSSRRKYIRADIFNELSVGRKNDSPGNNLNSG